LAPSAADELGNHRLSRTDGIDAVLRRHRLDALVMPTGAPPGKIDLVNESGRGSVQLAPSVLWSLLNADTPLDVKALGATTPRPAGAWPSLLDGTSRPVMLGGGAQPGRRHGR
jgi:hypothetical protein